MEDRVAWSRVLNMQVGIGPVAVEKILDNIRISNLSEFSNCENELSEIGSVLGAKGQVGWSDFLQIFEPLIKLNKEESSVGDFVRLIIESKYKEYLENEFPDYRERIQDLEQLAEFADKAEDLNSFLAEATLQEGFNNALANNTNNDEKIILSTVHQAKGLEWEAVFVINLASGQFPNDRALRESDGLEEERRLFYVAVTRAKKFLHLTYSLSGGFNSFSQGPSMFLEEISGDLIDMNSVGGGTVWDDLSDGDVVYESEDSGSFGGGFLKGIDEL